MPKKCLLNAAVILEDIAVGRKFERTHASIARDQLRLSGVPDQGILRITDGVASLSGGRGIRFTKGDRKLAEVLANVLRQAIERLYPTTGELVVPFEAE